jgi:ligand-binding sensor domain-containing protein/HPt (histidine-containing phosphotransfer) domain-containing protein
MKKIKQKIGVSTKTSKFTGCGFFMSKIISLLAIFGAITCFINPGHAQIKNINFDHINMEMGLSQSTILCITQDHEGYLWFGTQEGLNKYDGYKFNIFRSELSDPHTLSDNWITAILEDKEENLWIGTNAGGLNYFDCRKNKFFRFRHDKNDPNSLSNDRILALFEDQTGNLWIGTDGGGLNRYHKELGKFERYQFSDDDLSFINKNDVTSICEDQDGNLWWGTDGGGLYRLNWETGDFQNFKNDPKNPFSLSDDRIICLAMDSNSNIWIGTNGGGLNKFDLSDEKFQCFRYDPDNPQSISNDHVYAIFEDASGRLWIGTDDGLNQFISENNKFLSVRSNPADPNSLSNNLVRSIYEDRGGILWIGTYSGALNKLDIKKSAFKNYHQNPANPNSLSDKNVWSIYEDDKGFVWIGTNNGLNKLNRENGEFVHYFHDPNDPNSLNHNIVRYVYQDRSGSMWIGTEGGGLDKLNTKKNSFEHFIHNPNDSSSISDNGLRFIYEDKDGDLWIGTINGLNKFNNERNAFKRHLYDPKDPQSISGNHIRYMYEDRRGALWVATFSGLSLFIKKEDKFINFKHNPSNPSSISNDRVLCIYEDSRNRFWIGTYGGGLEQLDREEFIFTHYTVKDGLPNDGIYGILEDKKGNLWLSTNQGLSKFNPKNKSFKNYDINDGLQSNEFNGNAFHRNDKGEMFFGGINGFTVFSPREVMDNYNIPPVVISNFKKFDKEITLHHSFPEIDKIELSYKDDFFSFEFAALDFTNPSKNNYLYKLEGFDKEWIYSGNRRYANYTNLDGGKYFFRVKGSNNDGIWNEKGASVKLIIHPPFWQTWWFKFLVLLLLISLVYAIITLRMRSVNAQKRKLELEVAQRTRELNQTNYELLKAKKDTDDIFNNVEGGLFLLNPNLELASGYSLALEKMLSKQNLANFQFLKLLENRVSRDIVKSTEESLDLMFRKDVDEESLQELNPLSEIEMNFTDENGSWITSKHLSFNFKRISENSIVQNLIATVSDLTEQILLTRKLKLTEERTQNQMEWLVNILHIDPPLLNEFIEGAETELNYIDSLLKHGEGNGNFHRIIEEIYRSIHLIKGNATLLDLKFFVDLAHQFEDCISEVRKISDVKGKDFVPLVLHLSKIRQSLAEVKKLIERIGHFHQHFSVKKAQEDNILLKSIKNLVQNLSRDLGKEVEFIHDDFHMDDIPSRYRLLIKDIIIQFVRNSLYHGIERPDERIKMKKRSLATITLSSEFKNNRYSFQFKDDGRGLLLEKLKIKAAQSDMLKNKNIADWDKAELANLIFEPGFSTVDQVNSIAGRGIGMDVVKKKIEKNGGSIEITFEEGEYCKFLVTIPIKLRNKRTSNKAKRMEKVVSES